MHSASLKSLLRIGHRTLLALKSRSACQLYVHRAQLFGLGTGVPQYTTIAGGEGVGKQKSIEVCRLMGPQDANIAGNVHGGVILKMIEQAGLIISTRHCNLMRTEDSQTKLSEPERCIAGLVRVERTDFVSPMYIGEVAELHAEITHTAYHSMEVQVAVWAEDIITGSRRLTNHATLWYVPTKVRDLNEVLSVPGMTYGCPDDEAAGWKRYEKQKQMREGMQEITEDVEEYSQRGAEEHSVMYSQSSLIHLATVTDCNSANFTNGGTTMKVMDEVAAVVAYKHCRTHVVTASMDTVNFHQRIPRGSVIHVIGRPTFTSNRSIEIEVFVDAESMLRGQTRKQRAVHAFFTFVSLGGKKDITTIPQLKVKTEAETRRFAEGRERYEEHKRTRLMSKASSVKKGVN